MCRRSEKSRDRPWTYLSMTKTPPLWCPFGAIVVVAVRKRLGHFSSGPASVSFHVLRAFPFRIPYLRRRLWCPFRRRGHLRPPSTSYSYSAQRYSYSALPAISSK